MPKECVKIKIWCNWLLQVGMQGFSSPTFLVGIVRAKGLAIGGDGKPKAHAIGEQVRGDRVFWQNGRSPGNRLEQEIGEIWG